jgi:16S rRNA (guanine966-N2)-methyltransferase
LAELPAQEAPFDLVFVDPPYATSLAGRALIALAAAGVCRPGSEVVVQHSTRSPLPAVPGFPEHRRARRFGDTALTFLRAEGYTPDGSRP